MCVPGVLLVYFSRLTEPDEGGCRERQAAINIVYGLPDDTAVYVRSPDGLRCPFLKLFLTRIWQSFASAGYCE
jgi:hypothetical protein